MTDFQPFRDFDRINAQLALIGDEITARVNEARNQPDFEDRFRSLKKLREEVLEAAEALADAYAVVPTKEQIDTHYGRLGPIRRRLADVEMVLDFDRSGT